LHEMQVVRHGREGEYHGPRHPRPVGNAPCALKDWRKGLGIRVARALDKSA
jgi:hypothetical protein